MCDNYTAFKKQGKKNEEISLTYYCVIGIIFYSKCCLSILHKKIQGLLIMLHRFVYVDNNTLIKEQVLGCQAIVDKNGNVTKHYWPSL